MIRFQNERRDQQIKQLKEEVHQHQQQVEYLNQMLEETWKDTERNKISDKEKEQLEREDELKQDSNHLSDDKYESMLNKFAYEKEYGSKNLEELNVTLDNFYDNNLKQRQDALANIQKAVGDRLNASKKNAWCQTEYFLVENYKDPALCDSESEKDV